MGRLVIFGLDCAEPDLVFNKWTDDLPNIKRLINDGLHGPLKSTLPPITVPAWTSMMTSYDPGMLGFYGFRNRRGYGYDDLYFANAKYVKAKTIWNYLSRNRMRSLVFGVPQTYPPKPLNGMLVASFLTPGKDVSFTYPDEVRGELDRVADGDYIIDVEDFRTDRKDELLSAINVMTERRFKAFRHFYQKDSYDFAMLVEMGIDRIHHGFWRYFDKAHRLYEPGNRYESVIHDYYVMLDAEVGKTIDMLPPDTSVMVVSDHGAKTMVGAICINEWLQREGYLTLKERPGEQKRFKMDMVDWNRTKAWGEGGYYSRVFMNVQGREPNGVIPRDQYEDVRDELKARLEAIEDESGTCINTKVFKPEEVYRTVNNIPPDLIVYLGNLDWRSAGSVGVGSVYLYENDTGPDDANHAEEGILIWPIPGNNPVGQVSYSIYDIAPSVLKYFNIEIPDDMIGNPVF
ncbi:MAG: alkaline phosphatase family protein [Candidatus Hydrogenedentota bacterium]|nr:MAG: alkaline phosphatase family protein [Candidatus Hydrogenedentota bacterium]